MSEHRTHGVAVQRTTNRTQDLIVEDRTNHREISILLLVCPCGCVAERVMTAPRFLHEFHHLLQFWCHRCRNAPKYAEFRHLVREFANFHLHNRVTEIASEAGSQHVLEFRVRECRKCDFLPQRLAHGRDDLPKISHVCNERYWGKSTFFSNERVGPNANVASGHLQEIEDRVTLYARQVDDI